MKDKLTNSQKDMLMLFYGKDKYRFVNPEGHTMQDAARAAKLSYSAMTQRLKRLMDSGYLTRNPTGRQSTKWTYSLQLTWSGFLEATAIALEREVIAAPQPATTKLLGAPDNWLTLAGEALLPGSAEPPVDSPANGAGSSDNEEDEAAEAGEPFYYEHPDPQMVQMVRYLWEQGGDLPKGPADYCPMIGRDLDLPSDRVNTLLRRLMVDEVIERCVKDRRTLWVKLRLDPTAKPFDPNAESELEQPADDLVGLDYFSEPSEQLIYSKIIAHLKTVSSMGIDVMERLREITGENEGSIWRVVKRMDEVGAVVGRLSTVSKEIYLLRLGPLHEGADRREDEAPLKPFPVTRVASPDPTPTDWTPIRAAPEEPPVEEDDDASEDEAPKDELIVSAEQLEGSLAADEDQEHPTVQEEAATVTPLHLQTEEAGPATPVVESQTTLPTAPALPRALPAASADELDRSLAFELVHALARVRKLECQMKVAEARHVEEVDRLQKELEQVRSQQQAS